MKLKKKHPKLQSILLAGLVIQYVKYIIINTYFLKLFSLLCSLFFLFFRRNRVRSGGGTYVKKY